MKVQEEHLLIYSFLWVEDFFKKKKKTGVISANLRLEGNFLEVVKDLFISDVKVSAEHSHETFKIFDGIVLKGLAFLLLI